MDITKSKYIYVSYLIQFEEHYIDELNYNRRITKKAPFSNWLASNHIFFNREKDDYIILTYKEKRDRLNTVQGYTVRHYTFKTLPQKYAQFIW